MTEEKQPDTVPLPEQPEGQPPAPPLKDDHDSMIPGFGAIGE